MDAAMKQPIMETAMKNRSPPMQRGASGSGSKLVQPTLSFTPRCTSLNIFPPPLPPAPPPSKMSLRLKEAAPSISATWTQRPTSSAADVRSTSPQTPRNKSPQTPRGITRQFRPLVQPPMSTSKPRNGVEGMNSWKSLTTPRGNEKHMSLADYLDAKTRLGMNRDISVTPRTSRRSETARPQFVQPPMSTSKPRNGVDGMNSWASLGTPMANYMKPKPSLADVLDAKAQAFAKRSVSMPTMRSGPRTPGIASPPSRRCIIPEEKTASTFETPRMLRPPPSKPTDEE